MNYTRKNKTSEKGSISNNFYSTVKTIKTANTIGSS